MTQQLTRPGTAAAPVAAGSRSLPPARSWRRRDRWWGVAFVGPQLFGMLAFVLLPLLFGLALAFTRWDGLGPVTWVGTDNLTAQLADPAFRRAVLNTCGIALVTVPVGLGLAVVIAAALNTVRRRTFYLLLFFAPVVTSLVAVSMIWQQLLRQDGVLSGLVGALPGVDNPDWLGNPRLVLLSVCAVTIWSSLGLNVLLFLAGMQNIPPSVVEAARIDGAGPVRIFRSVTLPLLTPTVFFTTVISVISSLQTFDTVFILTRDGGPDNASRTIVYHVYDLGFRRFEFGASSAAALILLVLTLVVTLTQFGLQRRYVHYES